MSGRYERKKPQNQSTGNWKKTVLIVVLVIVVLIAALVVAAVVYYNSMLKKLNQVQVPTINYADLATEPTETTAAATEATAATVELPWPRRNPMLHPAPTISISFWSVRHPVRERPSGSRIP